MYHYSRESCKLRMCYQGNKASRLILPRMNFISLVLPRLPVQQKSLGSHLQDVFIINMQVSVHTYTLSTND